MERHRRESELYEQEIEDLRRRLAMAEDNNEYGGRGSEQGKGKGRGSRH